MNSSCEAGVDAQPAHKTTFLNTQHCLHESRATNTYLLKSLSLSYQRKDWQMGPCQSFLWYDTSVIRKEGLVVQVPCRPNPPFSVTITLKGMILQHTP